MTQIALFWQMDPTGSCFTTCAIVNDAYAMPAPTCRVLYICHSPFRLVYQLHQLDPRDLADPKGKEKKEYK